MLRSRFVAVLLVALVPLLPAGAEDAGTRIYLLADDDDGFRWSTTAHDPEAAASRVSQTCGIRQPNPATDQGQCRSFLDFGTGEYVHAFDFYPGALIDEAVLTTEPVRFHFEIDVAAAQPYTVHAIVDDEFSHFESGPAAEVAPGVWEGGLDIPQPFSGEITLLAAAVRTREPRVTIRLGTGGASWLELPRRVSSRSVPDLLAADTYAPAPAVYSGGTRTVWLNDDQWSAWSFSGDLTDTRTFDVPLADSVEMLIAWVDVFDSPPVYDLLRGGEVDPRELENSPGIRLLRDGEEITHGGNFGFTGNGQDSLATLALPAGDLQVEVRPTSWNPDGSAQDLDYTVHVLAVHGRRTLARMRWSLPPPNDFALLATRSCAYGVDAIPVTDDVTTMAVELDWDSAAVGIPDWTIRLDLLPFGEAVCGTGGDSFRFTIPPRDEIRYVGPAPEAHSLHVSMLDTVFELDVTYTYAPIEP